MGATDDLMDALRNIGYLYVAGAADYRVPLKEGATVRDFGLKRTSLLHPEVNGGPCPHIL